MRPTSFTEVLDGPSGGTSFPSDWPTVSVLANCSDIGWAFLLPPIDSGCPFVGSPEKLCISVTIRFWDSLLLLFLGGNWRGFGVGGL